MGSNTSSCFNGAPTSQEQNRGLPIATLTGISSNHISQPTAKNVTAIQRQRSGSRTEICSEVRRSSSQREPRQLRQSDSGIGSSSFRSRLNSPVRTTNNVSSTNSNRGKLSRSFYDIDGSSSRATTSSSIPLQRSASLDRSNSESVVRRPKCRVSSGTPVDFVNHESSTTPQVRTRKGRDHIISRMDTSHSISRMDMSLRRYPRISSDLDLTVSRAEFSEGLVRSRSMSREPRLENGIRLSYSLERASSGRSRDGRTHVSEQLLAYTSELAENRDSLLEERRRQAQSQVRVLRRLNNNFETMSIHERTCSLYGEDHTMFCSCRGTRRSNQTKYATSISRIILLAEALFEVLDELRNQNLGLSSQSSSIKPLPAPDNIVKSLPTRVYQESESYGVSEMAQCYICLMEYEEGELVKLLPCHHEFHASCVDKWLKEVHRVCPLCRGNVCSSDSYVTSTM